MRFPSNRFPTQESVISWHGFRVTTKIGSGSFAEVYESFHWETNIKIACKVIPFPSETFEDKQNLKQKTERRTQRLKDIKNELYALQEMRHPNIIKMIRHFVIRKDQKLTLYVFMQFATKGTMKQYLDKYGPFSEKKCKVWFAQLLSAMSYMHRKSMAHRDLKLANILLDDSYEVLISDFGLSRIAYRKSKGGILDSDTYCGTPPFMAPELLERKSYNAFLVDVWALGVILFKLFCKDYPFDMDNRVEAIHRMKIRKWYFTMTPQNLPTKGLTDILQKILEPDTNLRPTIDKLRKHFWIRREFIRVDKRAQKMIAETQKTIKTSKSMKTTVKNYKLKKKMSHLLILTLIF